MCPIAVDVLDQNVGGVWFGTEAVVTDVHPGIADCETIYIVGIPAVCVLRQVL